MKKQTVQEMLELLFTEFELNAYSLKAVLAKRGVSVTQPTLHRIRHGQIKRVSYDVGIEIREILHELQEGPDSDAVN